MITVDKEATIEFIRSAKEIFERFGSTRLLGVGFLLGFLAFLAHVDPEEALSYGGLGTATVLFLFLSYMQRPHDPKQPQQKVQ